MNTFFHTLRQLLPGKGAGAQGAVVAVTGSVIYNVNAYGFQFTQIDGPSMLPTFNQRGDYVLATSLSRQSQDVKVGDVIIAHSPETVGKTVVKRVLGLPGDVVRIPSESSLLSDRHVTVPPGHIWLAGDNPNNSNDSRSYGPVPYNLLISKVVLRLLPLDKVGSIPWETEERDRTFIAQEATPTPAVNQSE